MRQTTLYLAGPMTGIPQFNYPMFDKAAEELRQMGLAVQSPAEMDDQETRRAAMASVDGDLSKLVKATGETWGDFLARDLKLIADGGIDGIATLSAWYKSRGARQEVFTAINIGLPVYNAAEIVYRRKLVAVEYDSLLRQIALGLGL